MRFGVLTAVLGSMLLLAGATAAQDMPGGMAMDEGDAPMSTSSPFQGTMTQSDEFAFRRWFDNARMMNRRADASDKADAAALAGKLALSCTPTDAALVGIQRDTDGARIIGRIYEIACSNGAGYLLVSQTRQDPFALSCFSIDAARAEAKDQSAAVACTLPANADVKAMAASIAKQAGTDCAPRQVRWIGEGTKSKMDFTELACTDGNGYVIAVAMPGAQSPLQVMPCALAAPRGIPCSLTASAAPTITLQTFKDALTQHGVDCDASQIRVIGKESGSHRHVVEFQCTAQHRDLVAYIPLSDGTKPFETVDCAAAAGRGIACRFGTAN